MGGIFPPVVDLAPRATWKFSFDVRDYWSPEGDVRHVDLMRPGVYQLSVYLIGRDPDVPIKDQRKPGQKSPYWAGATESNPVLLTIPPK
jgi:hypothetical protein